jgi:hypothetical protein
MKTMKIVLFLGLFLAAPLGRSQGVLYKDYALTIANNGDLKPVPKAKITICAANTPGTPCAPTTPVFSDQALTLQITQPFLADALGQYSFYGAPGFYTVSISGAGAVPSSFTLEIYCGTGSSCGGGGGSVSGSGTTNTVTKFTAATVIGDSAWTDTGTASTYSGSGGVSTNSVTFTGTAPFADTGVEGLAANCPPIVAGQDNTCNISDLSPRGKYLSNNGGAYAPIGTSGASGTVTNIATTAPLSGGPITTTGTLSLTANGIGNAQLAAVQVVRNIIMNFGAKNGSLLTTGDIQPQDALADIPYPATVTLVIVYVDSGASTVQVGYRHNGSTTTITPVMTPAVVAGITDPVACANVGGTAVTLQGNSVTCSTLTNTALAAHDVIETLAGTADAVSRHMNINLEATVN